MATVAPKYFEDISKGEIFAFPRITITATLREAHVRLYGEDWPEVALRESPQRQIIPAPLIISVLAGQMGKSNFMRVKYMKDFSVRCCHPVYVSDTIATRNVVEEIRPHKDPTKDYGYAFIEQAVSNQEGVVCYLRRICYLIYRRASRCVV
ncbi:MAG: hypothetical protein ACREYF_27540 [Gammaproteobacteria bacterium]